MKFRWFLWFVLLFPVALCHGQANLYMEPAYRMGRVIPNASNTRFLSHVSTYGAELRLGHQTTGKHDWERLFNYPEYGLCLRYAHFDTTMFGETAALIA